jgi:hypothetical protein
VGLVAQRLEQRTHNGNPTIVDIGVPGIFNELTARGFPSFPIIPGLGTQKQRKRVRRSLFPVRQPEIPQDFCTVPRFHRRRFAKPFLGTKHLTGSNPLSARSFGINLLA